MRMCVLDYYGLKETFIIRGTGLAGEVKAWIYEYEHLSVPVLVSFSIYFALDLRMFKTIQLRTEDDLQTASSPSISRRTAKSHESQRGATSNLISSCASRPPNALP